MPRPVLPFAHSSAIISDAARIAADVRIGPFTVIDGAVQIGPGCVIGAGVHLIGPMILGANNTICSGAILGGAPQHAAYRGEPTALEIGDGNTFRENVTVHRGMPIGVGAGSGTTRIGNHNTFMVGSHVGHDCVIGNDCVLVNGAVVGGHAVLEDRVTLSGNAAVHQFCRVGRLAFVSGLSATSKDLPPFWIVREVNVVRGVNVVGMRRAGLSQLDILAVRKAFRIIYLTRPALLLGEAAHRIEAELGHVPAVKEVVDFIRASKRGVCGSHRYSGSDAADERAAA